MENELTNKPVNLFNGTYHGTWNGNIIELRDYKGTCFYVIETIKFSNVPENVSVTIKGYKVVDWDYL